MSATGRIMMASILTMLMLLACRTPPPAPARQAVHLLDLAPVAVFAGDTTRLIPPTESSRGLLETGWEMPAEEDSVEALWRPGERGEARFYIVHPASMTLRTELFSEVPERVEVLVNGKNVGSFACKEQWNTYQLRLQPEVLTAGWNTLALSFKAGQGSAQGTRGCRLLELQPVGWKSAAEPNLGARLSQGGRLLATPFRTSFTVYLDLGTESRLSGQIKRTEMGKGLACLELRNWKGQYETLLETDQEKEFELDLSAWDGQIVELRLSCKGTPGSAVSWADPVLSWREGTSRNRTQPVRLEEPPSSGRLGRQNIIVIMLDAARADAFGPETTPRCQAIAEEGTIFSRAHSPADWTAQSVAALMTGLYPGTLGVDSWASSLPQDVPRMAEIMQDRGYHTGVWTEHNLWGFEPPSLELWKGFDVSLEMFLEQSPVRTDVRVPSVEQLFDPTRPNFVFLHLLPPHLPYAPPAPFFGCRTSWYKGKLSCTDLEIQNINNRIATPSEQDIRFVHDRYLENVKAIDHVIGQFIDQLKGLGYYDESLIIVTSDHGEAMYEHGLLVHGNGHLYEECTRIPLLVKWPRSAQGYVSEVDQLVSLVDLFPTILDGIGEVGRLRFQGRSFLPLAFDRARSAAPVFCESTGARLESGEKPVNAIVWRNWKAVLHSAAWSQSHGSEECYFLKEDPGESTNLRAEKSWISGYLLQRLRSQMAYQKRTRAEWDHPPSGQLSPRVVEQLRSLGYI